MKFRPLLAAPSPTDRLDEDYRTGHPIGVLRLGERALFFRRMAKVWYIPYADVTRCFRRVQLVPARLCCGKGDLQVENLVICHDGEEIAMVQLPGTRAAEALMQELREKIPGARFGKPEEGEAL